MKLNYQTWGDPDKPVVVILHGALGSLRNWSSVARKISDQYFVVNADLRNHGDSPHADLMDFESMAEDVIELVQEFSAPVFAAGHSLGAKVLMKAVAMRPELFAKTVFVDLAPRVYSIRFFDEMCSIGKMDLAKITSRQDADEMLTEYVPNWALRTFLLTNLRKNEHGFYWRVNIDSLIKHRDEMGANPVADVDEISVPALFIRGANSNCITDADWENIQKQFRNVKLETISGCGHNPHMEDSERVMEALRDFFVD